MSQARVVTAEQREVGHAISATSLVDVCQYREMTGNGSADPGLAGCAPLGDALSTGNALGQAGSSRWPIAADRQAGAKEVAVRAEHIVWDSYAARFGAVAIFTVSGGCTGPVCATDSRQIAGATYSQLSSEFGPRPRGPHGASLMSEFSFSGWDIASSVIVVVSALSMVIVARRRRRRQGPPSRPGAPGREGRGRSQDRRAPSAWRFRGNVDRASQPASSVPWSGNCPSGHRWPRREPHRLGTVRPRDRSSATNRSVSCSRSRPAALA